MAIIGVLLRFVGLGFRVVLPLAAQVGLIGIIISLSLRPLRFVSIVSPNLGKIISLVRARDDNDDHNYHTLKELDPEKLTIYVTSLVIVVLITPFIGRMERTHRNLKYHIVFAASVGATLLLLPEFIQDEIFSPGGVVVVGTIVPIYESIEAVCTIGETDDVSWLQYWVTAGALSYATEFIDDIRYAFPAGGEHWYEFEFFFSLWLLLPQTDGAYIIYKVFTRPLVVPVANRITRMCGGWMQLLVVVVNASHLWILWSVFISVPEEQRRFIVVAVGTVYPTAASIVAVSKVGKGGGTAASRADSTFWLTYWSCFSILFLAMDYSENLLGEIRGFYTICLCITLWLFLPIFNGADYVFRKVLVPLTGQYENMILRDIYLARTEIEAMVPEKQRSRVLQRAVDMFRKTHAA